METVPILAKRRTKIVATLGPSSSSEEVIADLIESGVNIFRLNFSHGNHQTHENNIKNVRALSKKVGRHVGILGDLQGPKIRLGELQQEEKQLKDGEVITLTTNAGTEDSTIGRILVTYAPLPESVAAGDILLLDDGRIRMQVNSVSGKDVECTVIQAGILKSRKGINRLGGGLAADAITEKDLQDLQCMIKNQLEYIAVSFPCTGSDLLPVRTALEAANCRAHVIAKIERAEVVASKESLQELIDAADGVMVARGDLGVEIGDAKLIGVQKRIILAARRANKPVITATQMMESMISEPVPTRAEVFDVANAVLDGTDAVMLSGETASGKFPAKVVQAMAETAEGAERYPEIHTTGYLADKSIAAINHGIAVSAMLAAAQIENVAGVICLTESGSTPLVASRLTSTLPIYAISRNLEACRRVALYRGVIPLYYDVTQGNDVFEEVLKIINEKSQLQAGQRFVCTFGDFAGEGGFTNTIKVLTYNP